MCRLKQRFQLPSLIQSLRAFSITLGTDSNRLFQESQDKADMEEIRDPQYILGQEEGTETVMKNLIIMRNCIYCLESGKYYVWCSHTHAGEAGTGIPRADSQQKTKLEIKLNPKMHELLVLPKHPTKSKVLTAFRYY